MLYCVKALTVRSGPNYCHKFMLCKKRTPRIGFVFSKIGTLNNYFNSYSKRTAFFNIKKVASIYNYGYKMNRAAYKNLGVLFSNESSKKRRHY